MSGKPETVAERIVDLMQSLPPKEGRNSRLGHISIEDFAELLGTSKQRLIDWRKGEGFPDDRNRERLAAVSEGRYEADDFRGPGAAGRREMAVRLEELEAKVASLRKEHADFVRVATERMARLEANLASPKQQSTQPSKRRRGEAS